MLKVQSMHVELHLRIVLRVRSPDFLFSGLLKVFMAKTLAFPQTGEGEGGRAFATPKENQSIGVTRHSSVTEPNFKLAMRCRVFIDQEEAGVTHPCDNAIFGIVSAGKNPADTG